MESKIEHILFEHSYDLHTDEEQFVINDEDSNSVMSIVLWMIGLILLGPGAFVSIWLAGSGAVCLFFSMRTLFKRTPKKIVFWKKEKILELQFDVIGNRKLPYHEIKEFFATSETEANLSSPFEQGNKLYDYDIFVRMNNGRERKIMHIEFHEAHDHDMQELALALNKMTGTV